MVWHLGQQEGPWSDSFVKAVLAYAYSNYWIKRFNRKETKGRRQVQLVDDALTHLNDENYVHLKLKGIPCKDLAQ